MANHPGHKASRLGSNQIPIRPSLGILGRKWTARILADIGFRKITRFNQILSANPGLTPRLLSKRLRELESEAVIKRRVVNRRRKEVRWSLAPKGDEMLPILMELLVFGSKWNNPYRSGGRLPTLALDTPS